MKHFDKHHRIPRSLVRGQEVSNVVVRVDMNHHRAWHTLFRNMTPEQICQEINKVWGDPRYTFKAERRKV